jgi:hypothetical protein
MVSIPGAGSRAPGAETHAEQVQLGEEVCSVLTEPGWGSVVEYVSVLTASDSTEIRETIASTARAPDRFGCLFDAARFRPNDRQVSHAVLVCKLLETLQLFSAARMPETTVADLMKTCHRCHRYQVCASCGCSVW